MRESTVVNEWKNEGKAEGRAEDILELLTERFGQSLPSDLVTHIRETTDLPLLKEWLKAVYKAPSLDAFCQIVFANGATKSHQN